MAQARTDEETFVSLFQSLGAASTARKLGIDVRRVYKWRKRLEESRGHSILGPSTPTKSERHPQYHHRVIAAVENGTVLIGSDAHYWPGEVTTAHRAFVHLAEKLQPKLVIQNGDVLDGSTISRHPPIGWESRPMLADEVETCKERLSELEFAAPKARLIWSLGNHDARFETRLASQAPEYARVHGVHLQDHFPRWEPCWAAWINDGVVVKHRYKSGIHAPHNNTMWAGKTMVTGHLHSLKVQPFTDYNGTRFGVDTGTLAEPFGSQFTDYTEDGPRNWRSGFAVLTFKDGRLLWPEVVHVIEDGKVEFRGEVIDV